MAKGIGLIGNFKGKVGNMVGYKLTDSNSGNTQGIRVYQPIVKNPKTAAQAEQRAKLAPINVTYRALKMVIDRGNEGLPYGNKSRLAWLKQAFRAEEMPWFKKGASIASPVLCQVSKGSLASFFSPSNGDSSLKITVAGLTDQTTTIGAVSTALLAAFSTLRNGDQLTFVQIEALRGSMVPYIDSIVLDTTSTSSLPGFLVCETGKLVTTDVQGDAIAGCVIVSREGANGEHLRSTEKLYQMAGYDTATYGADSKTAAIESYMSSAAVNADWAEESIQ